MDKIVFPSRRKLDLLHDEKSIIYLEKKANMLRQRMLMLGKSLGIRLHYGGMFSCAEILITLYAFWMRHNPEKQDWPGRDRFVLSKGHAAPILYGVLSDAGYFPDEELNKFRCLGSILQGHPDRNKTPGIDTTTGSLGQGMPVACGMALASRYTEEPYHVYTLISDGECNEGSIWEAAMIASNLDIGNLTVLVDWNGKSSYGPMSTRNDVEPFREKWLAFGWYVEECDGHDFSELTESLYRSEKELKKPSIILCHTVKNKGIPYGEKHRTRSNYYLDEHNYTEAMENLKRIEENLKK